MWLRRTPLGLATAIVIACATAMVAACSAPAAPRRPAGALGGDCSPSPTLSALPSWARAGFTPPDTPMPHVLGARGEIIAILWAPKNPLWAPPLATRGNKILWVSRVPPTVYAPMRIRATLAGTARTAGVTLPGGPGPSLINMPAPGCWTMRVSWAGNSDLVRLWYASAPGR